MAGGCLVSGCNNEGYPGCGISFHRLPTNKEMRDKWIEVIPSRRKLSKTSSVCTAHFKAEDYMSDHRRKLKPGAIPSLFPKLLKSWSIDVSRPLPYLQQRLANCNSSNVGSNSQYNFENRNMTAEDQEYTNEKILTHETKCLVIIPLHVNNRDACSNVRRDTYDTSYSTYKDQLTESEENSEVEVSDNESRTNDNEGHEFSWHNDKTVNCDEELESEYFEDVDDISMFNKETADRSTDVDNSHQRVPDAEEGNSITHDWYKCNVCSGNISGFRYTCVQCADFDLCATCESRGAHAAHYVLRVPGPRPPSEIQSVLTTIRRLLLNDSVIQLESTSTDEMLHEIKKEPEDSTCVKLAPPASLGNLDDSIERFDIDHQEGNYSEISDDDTTHVVRLRVKTKTLSRTSSPRRKRKRVTSKASSENYTPSDEGIAVLRERTSRTRQKSDGYYYFDKEERCMVLQSTMSDQSLRSVMSEDKFSNSGYATSPTHPVYTRDVIQLQRAQLLTETAYVRLQRLSLLDIEAALHSSI